MTFRFLSVFIPVFIAQLTFGQVQLGDTVDVDYSSPQLYTIGDITVTGSPHLDANVLTMISGLSRGQEIYIPGEKIADAIDNLWNQGLFSDVGIYATRFQGEYVFLEIRVTERPRLTQYSFNNVKKADAEDIRENFGIVRGQVVTENMKRSLEQRTRDFYISKGYLNAEVSVSEIPDTAQLNAVQLVIGVDRKEKVKVQDIIFNGNVALTDGQLRRSMKETKRARWYTFFNSSKFIEEEYEADKIALIARYNESGYRDAQIVSDSVYQISDDRVNVEITIDEGRQYYFRDINWNGNSRYSDEELQAVLGINRGDIYDRQLLESRLYMNPNGRDVSSLYMDDGYLFFNITPVEVLVENDSIDLEMRIYEGRQARVNKVIITGNTKTHDHVILREIRTKPGDLFSRSDVMRTTRELAQLGYFDPERLAVNPKPNPADGTVDIEYVVEEKPSDQLELSGGFGQGRVVGTLGVSFNNFSARNIFNKNAWRPLPSGDGQRLSIRAQSTGLYYQSYNFSFTEPWLGGRKPNALSISMYHTVSSNGQAKFIETDTSRIINPSRQAIKITGAAIGLGKRLRWPDDYFTLYQEIGFQQYELQNYTEFLFTNGTSNNLHYKAILSRNSIDQPIYPRSGSQTSLTLQATFPYSVFSDKDYSQLELNERFRWTEYHKWKFSSAWYTRLAGNLVLYSKAGFGFLGLYNRELGVTPFERFSLGGSGLTGAGGSAFFLGKELIAMRGYEENTLSASVGSNLIAKYTLELRYPVSLNPSATIYLLAFTDGGNTWNRFSEFNPFDVYRSAGVGIRVFLPMFGLLGLDYGFRLDEGPGGQLKGKGTPTFTIGFNLGEL